MNSIWTKISVTAILLFHFSGLLLGQHNCGTEFSDENMDHFKNVLKRTTIVNAKDGDLACVPIRYHVVRETDGSTSSTPLDFIESISNLNYVYFDAGISFFLIEPPVYIDNSAFTELPNTTENDVVNLFNSPQDAVNVYVLESLNPGTAGYAYYPTANIVSNRIFIRCTSVNASIAGTMSHELGHYFGLPHTFAGTEDGPLTPDAENVVRTGPGANCDTNGDSFCDTEADPGSDYLAGCVYTGNITDANGDFYTPLTDNVMSYYLGDCRVGFTPEQHAALQQGYQVRSGFTDYNYDAVPMTISAPSQLSATVVGNNIELSFVDNADNEFGYLLEYSTDGINNFKGYPATGNLENETSFVVDFDPSLNYWFRVRPVNAGCDSYSNTVFITSGIDLDKNNSSGADGNNFDANSLCGNGSVTMADSDVDVVGNVNQVTVHIQLTGNLNGQDEFIVGPVLDGLTIEGNNSSYIIAHNVGDLTSTQIANWISSLTYHHQGESITDGTREVNVWISSNGVNSTRSISSIDVAKNYQAGSGGLLTACPSGLGTWATLLPENATEGGIWTDGNGNTLLGTVDFSSLSNPYSYTIGPDYCQKIEDYNIVQVEAPEYTLSVNQPECETKCDGSIEITYEDGFTAFLDDSFFDKSITDLCEGEFEILVTNGTGCNRTESVRLRYQTNPFLTFPAELCTADMVTLSDYFQGLPAGTRGAMNGRPVSLVTPIHLESDDTLSLHLFNQDACINRTVNFYTFFCPTPINNIFFIPNAFTPNGDGLNDLFKPNCIFDLAFYELLIFDRTGNLIFESDNQNLGWNGAGKGSEDYFLNKSVFNYRLRYKLPNDVENTEISGSVTLLR